MAATVVFLLVIIVPSASPYLENPHGPAQVSVKGEELWMVDSLQRIFRWNGGKLENIPGWATNVGASPDGWTWVISASFSIQRWNPNKKIWEVMPGQGYQVNAISKDVAVVVGIDYMIYMWKANVWTKIGQHAIWVAIGEREEVWAVNRYDGSLWYWQYPWLGLRGWEHQAVTGAVTVDVHNSTRMVFVDNDVPMTVYKRVGNSWQVAASFLHSVSVSKTSMTGIYSTLYAYLSNYD